MLQYWDLSSFRWIRSDWKSGTFAFGEIDVVRIKLIRQLGEEMDINEEALQVVLSLLDYIYERRSLTLRRNISSAMR